MPISNLALDLLGHRPTEEPAGRRIGPHRLIRVLGQGGMGTIYLAERDDGQYQEQVAVKLIQHGRDRDAIVQRFYRERQILADLDHPNIARLLDGGVTDEGRPYFVMEYIEGQPIDRYCQESNLDTAARVALLCSVCQAVQAAHRSLIVHCDLKPSNILVTSDGQPKLLDFGVARLLELDDRGESPVTIAERPMTLAYASPEQVCRKPPTTASDVYSLGVVLFELLTGQRPFDFAGRSPSEIEHIVSNQEAPRPSDSLPDHSRRQLRGDLDTIVQKALRKEPTRRYTSCERLADDLKRFLEGAPVLARTPTFGYRATKFIRRHWLGVSTAVALLATLLGGVVSTVYQARVARSRGLTAERTLGYLVELFETADPDRNAGRRLTLEDVLDSGSSKIDELADEPLAQATLMTTLGEVYRKLAVFEPAEKLLTSGAEIRRRHLPDSHPDLATVLSHLGQLHLDRGEFEDSEPLLREALELRRQSRGTQHHEVAKGLHVLGHLLFARGRYDEAEARYREALAMRQEILGEDHPDVATTLNNLGMTRLRQGDLNDALELLERALAIRQAAFGEEHWRVANTWTNLALTHRERGDLDRAETLYRQALPVQRRLLGEHTMVARTLNNLAAVLYIKRHMAEAEQLYSEALEMQIRLVGEDHPAVAGSKHNLGRFLLRRGDAVAAERLLSEALESARRHLGPRHQNVARGLQGHALALAALGRGDEAQAELRQAIALYRETTAGHHPRLASPLESLAALLNEAGNSAAAEPLLREALAIRRANEQKPSRIARSEALLGDCLSRLGRHTEARSLLEESLRTLTETLGSDNEKTRQVRTLLAAVPRSSVSR